MKILLVDDNPLFLDGLRNMLEANGYEVAGTAAGGGEALALAERLSPDLMLMDVQMPGLDGIGTTRILKQKYPRMKIVILTISESDEHLFDAIAAGASGYLVKGECPERFLESLAEAARGESPLSQGLAARIMAEFARREQLSGKPELAEPPEAPSPASLTARQAEILRLVAVGRPYKEIALSLGLSEATIKYHMSEITTRLHLENRAQAIAYASRTAMAHPSECD